MITYTLLDLQDNWNNEMTDYKEYKIKIIYKKCNSSLSDGDCDTNHCNTYIEYMDPDSLFGKKYCNDYGEVD